MQLEFEIAKLRLKCRGQWPARGVTHNSRDGWILAVAQSLFKSSQNRSCILHFSFRFKLAPAAARWLYGGQLTKKTYLKHIIHASPAPWQKGVVPHNPLTVKFAQTFIGRLEAATYQALQAAVKDPDAYAIYLL